MNKLDMERTKIQRPFHGGHAVRDAKLADTNLGHSNGEPATKNLHVLETREDVGKATNMVHVWMGEDNSMEMFTRLFQITNIGNDRVHSESAVLGETHATVDHQLIVTQFVNVHIFGSRTDTAKRNQLKLRHNFL